ncbi:MAG: DUF4411 family protein [Bacteroidetes bacterium]|nr:DUF4411 family protein [Bacteroidota bacterium]
MPPFLLDANFFITAHRFWYPFDVVPSFWARVSELAHAGKIISIDKVGTEIREGNDALKDWVNAQLPAGFFTESAIAIDEYTRVATWAVGRGAHYSSAAIAEFLDADEADAWLVAMAMRKRLPITTYEVSNPGMKRRIAIPEPCNHFGVSFLDTMAMFRSLGVTL